MGFFTRTKEYAPCTVEISHKFESLHAHVRFNNGAVIHPGDEVQVQGPEIMAPFGEIVSCLLYTSPSPRDLSTSRMPSSA